MSNSGIVIQPPPDGENALAVTLIWLSTLNWTDNYREFVLEPLDVSGAPGTLAERLAAANLTDWRNAIIATSSGQSHLGSHLSWLMGQAALELAVGIYQPGTFFAIEKLQMLAEMSDAELASAVCNRFVGASAAHPLLEHLRTRLQMLWNAPFNERTRRYAETTATSPLTTRDIWPRRDGMPVGDGWAHQVVARLCPDRYMEMLARFPAQFQLGFGEVLSPVGLELIASLIRVSPRVFSDDGVPLGPAGVFMLLDAIETHFAVIDAQELSATEIGLESVLDSVFSRCDGNWIGRAWLQQIIWRDTRRRAGRDEVDVTAQRNLRDRLIVQLSARIAPLGNAVFDWVRQEEPLWRVDRVLCESSILEAHKNIIDAAEVLAKAIREGLVSATGRSAGLVSSSPEATIIARVLSQLPNMKQWFETLWYDTYDLREHLSYAAHSDLDNPAYPALAWGLIGLNSSQLAPVDTTALWRTIRDAVFETQRIDPNATLPNGTMLPITHVTVQLGAALCERGIVPVSDFALFMADQLEPTAEHARLWYLARSEASDTVTLEVGRMVGAELICEALKVGLTQNRPRWGTALSLSEKDNLNAFSNRLCMG